MKYFSLRNFLINFSCLQQTPHNAPAIPPNPEIMLAARENIETDGSDDDEIIEILGARPADDNIEFEVKKKNGSTQIVNSIIANHKWPQAVISFYEARLVFNH